MTQLYLIARTAESQVNNVIRNKNDYIDVCNDELRQIRAAFDMIAFTGAPLAQMPCSRFIGLVMTSQKNWVNMYLSARFFGKMNKIKNGGACLWVKN